MSALNKDLFTLFKNPRHETVEDVIAVGGVLEPAILKHAYKHGIFPWPHEGYPLLWFSPAKRGVIEFAELHLARSFLKWLKKNQNVFEIHFNTRFSDVVQHCKMQKRSGQKGSWINSEIQDAYQKLFDQGAAFSLEVLRDSKLVAGIYGVRSEKYLSCESMFHLEDNTSKLALYKLIEKLKAEGHTWIDIQMVTSVCESFGGKLITQKQFLKKIGV
jgi:leucyl/phenylalanyl-tRNA--protein transferase